MFRLYSPGLSEGNIASYEQIVHRNYNYNNHYDNYDLAENLYASAAEKFESN